MGRLVFVLLIGLGGAAILISLGVWQVQRLAWKEDVLADIDARISAAPVPLPASPDINSDAYLPVTVSGTFSEAYLKILVSQKQVGAGYRIVGALDLPDGAVLVDRGFIRTGDLADADLTAVGLQTIVGNLQWPQEIDSYTPAPDLERNIWFARDVDAMADALGTRPILVVQRAASQSGSALTPLPVDTSAIPNDHLQYAITWFSLAAVWLAMTTMFLRRSGGSTQS